MKISKEYRAYYKQLVGMTVIDTSFADDGMPVLILRDKYGHSFQVLVSADEEGNDAGHLFIDPIRERKRRG